MSAITCAWTAARSIEGDATRVAALERLIEERRPWLDPDLTRARIWCRLGLPAEVILAGGFQTKPNFNRAFLRAMGPAPSDRAKVP